MPNIINIGFSSILQDEANSTINNIASDIFKNGITYSGINRTGTNIGGDKTGQNASGKTIQSLRSEIKPNQLSIFGRAKFSELETGTPPNSGVTPNTIYLWSQYKNIKFGSDKQRYWFSVHASNKINREGTLLFRKGGRRDVYSDKVQPLIERISERVGKEIVNIKLIE